MKKPRELRVMVPYWKLRRILCDATDQIRIPAPLLRLRVRLPQDVRGDWPVGHNIVARAGIHKPILSRHGAISVIARDRQQLGIKPAEFEWVFPYDRLWVPEGWCCQADENDCIVLDKFHYEADGVEVRAIDGDGFQRWRKDGTAATPWISQARMPRSAARIILQINKIELQRVQDITDAEATREGVMAFTKDGNLMKYWVCDPGDGPIKCAWSDLPRSAAAAYLQNIRIRTQFCWAISFYRTKESANAN